jgi:hypothetical protein
VTISLSPFGRVGKVQGAHRNVLISEENINVIITNV